MRDAFVFRTVSGLAMALAIAAGPAIAQDAKPDDKSASEKSAADKARAEFVRGTELVEQSRWAEALAAFERAREAQPHAVTTFNIGACERAMGRYTRAKTTFEQALGENEASQGQQLSSSLVEETKGYIAEIEALLARADVTLVPNTASIAVDGRPLVQTSTSGPPIAMAGVRTPGKGEPAPAGSFAVLLDPGTHVFLLTRKGFSDAVVMKSFAPGSTQALKLELDSLPATLSIESNRKGALVKLDGRDVGPVPVDVARPAGRHHVSVQQNGFERYEADVTVKAGEFVQLNAALKPRKPLIVEQWWFWTVAGVVVTGAVVGTYFATRPEPARPPVDGGSLGWKVGF